MNSEPKKVKVMKIYCYAIDYKKVFSTFTEYNTKYKIMKRTIFLLLISLIIFSCNKDDEDEKYQAEYTISTGIDALLNGNSAVAMGKLRLTTGTVLDHGHCWSQYPNPTVESDSHSSLGESNESIEFFSEMDNLKISTNYFVRSYAKDASGIRYGNEVAIRTTDLNIRNIDVWKKTVSAVTLAVKLDITTMAPVKYGFCWAEHDNPTLDDHKKESHQYNNSTNVFFLKIDKLDAEKTYYFRAYAILGFTSYSKVFQVKLNSIEFESLSIETLSDSSLSVRTKFNINTNIKDHGICWAKNNNPQISDSKYSRGTAVSPNEVNFSINGLETDVDYYFSAYIVLENDSILYSDINSVRLAFEASFGSMHLSQPYNFYLRARTSYSSNGAITDYGVCYSDSPNPKITDNIYSIGSSIQSGSITCNIECEGDIDTYYFRSYIVNKSGVATYSQEYTLDFVFPLTLPQYPGNGKWSAIDFNIDGELFYGLCRDANNKDFWSFDKEELKWNRVAYFPNANYSVDHYNVSHTSNKNGYVFCLTSDKKDVETHKYNPDNNEWDIKATLDFGYEIQYLSSIFVDDRTFLLIKKRSTSRYNIYELTASNTWDYITYFNNSSYFQFSFAIGRDIYMTNENDVKVFNLDDLSFTNKNDKPSFSSSNYIENWAHYFEYKGDVYISAETKVYKYYPGPDVWITKSDLDGFSDEATSIIINGRIFIGLGQLNRSFVNYQL